uniref:RCC1 domain-containing protein n=1 Tax=Rhabditophanes sp. KR3021 TaxID=114890 RepID=A0AC35TQ17_9BILA
MEDPIIFESQFFLYFGEQMKCCYDKNKHSLFLNAPSLGLIQEFHFLIEKTFVAVTSTASWISFLFEEPNSSTILALNIGNIQSEKIAKQIIIDDNGMREKNLPWDELFTFSCPEYKCLDFEEKCVPHSRFTSTTNSIVYLNESGSKMFIVHNDNSNPAIELPLPINFISIHGGYEFILLFGITDGLARFFTIGYGHHGSLGTGETVNAEYPLEVSNLPTSKVVNCKIKKFGVKLTYEDNSRIVWGWNWEQSLSKELEDKIVISSPQFL